MRIPRIFHAGMLNAHAELDLSESAAKHVARVLRLREQSPLVIFNGEGGEYKAHINAIEKHRVAVKLDEFNERNVESPLRIVLAQGISRGERMDYTLQKAVELGITKIVVLCPVCGGAELCFFTKHHSFEGCSKHELYWIERTGHFDHHTDGEFLETAQVLFRWGFNAENDADERVIYSPSDSGVRKMLFEDLSNTAK